MPLLEPPSLPAGTPLADLPVLVASLPHLTPSEAAEFAADLDAARTELGRVEVWADT
jgi:hypothetical protein